MKADHPIPQRVRVVGFRHSRRKFMAQQTELKVVALDKVIPYDRNPRRNEQAVPGVMNSILAHGYRDFIEVDEDFIILAGHTRHKALVRLHEKGLLSTVVNIEDGGKIPVLIHKGIQIKNGYRIENNKSGEWAEWDTAVLQDLLSELEVEGADIPEVTGFSLREFEDLKLGLDVKDHSGLPSTQRFRGGTGHTFMILALGRLAARIDFKVGDQLINKIQEQWGEDAEKAVNSFAQWCLSEDFS
jgi:hypothetical protein